MHADPKRSRKSRVVALVLSVDVSKWLRSWKVIQVGGYSSSRGNTAQADPNVAGAKQEENPGGPIVRKLKSDAIRRIQ